MARAAHISWHQGGIFSARLSLPKTAANFAIKKLGDSGRRLPTFWGPGHDWVPDHNWGGAGMIGLQEMLVQSHDRKQNMAAARLARRLGRRFQAARAIPDNA